jgi:uncharacterized membrane protein SpoIIM required for sporulation
VNATADSHHQPLHTQPLHPQEQTLTRFEQLLDQCEKLRRRGLGFDDLRELARLYRQHSAQLSRLRDRDSDPDAIRHLNSLCVRAYGFLYSSAALAQSEPRSWREEIPAALARTWRVQMLAWALLLAGIAMGAALSARDPGALYALLPSEFGYSPENIDRLWSSADARADFLAREEADSGHNTLFGSWLFTHNTRVGMLSFATGILAGIPTVLLQLYNGLTLGGFATLFFRDSWPIHFAAWLLPHAIPELTAITLCCAAGLAIGGAVAAPHRRPRKRALREASGSALVLFAISVPLFLLAALTESFIRESALGTAPRLAVALSFLALLLAGLASVYRLARRTPVDTRWLRDTIPPPE